jgi:hypothetical protein
MILHGHETHVSLREEHMLMVPEKGGGWRIVTSYREEEHSG